MIVQLCRFFHALPSQILDEDADIMQLMKLYRLVDDGEDSFDG